MNNEAKKWLEEKKIIFHTPAQEEHCIRLLTEYDERDRWIPIANLPEVGEERIWQTSCGVQYMGYLSDDKRLVYRRGGSSFEYVEEFVAHRPLPAPYNPKGD